MNIRLHPQYGLNPTIAQCLLCGRDKKEIAFLGSAYKDEAPMNMVINDEPCDECKKYMKIGVMLICVKDGTDQQNPYRTGKIAVLKEEVAQRIFNNIGHSRVAFIEESAWDQLGLS